MELFASVCLTKLEVPLKMLFFFAEKGVDISSDKLQRGPHKKTKLQTSPTVKRPRRRHPSAVGGAPLLLLP
jgi:hypothetical protein